MKWYRNWMNAVYEAMATRTPFRDFFLSLVWIILLTIVMSFLEYWISGTLAPADVHMIFVGCMFGLILYYLVDIRVWLRGLFVSLYPMVQDRIKQDMAAQKESNDEKQEDSTGRIH